MTKNVQCCKITKNVQVEKPIYVKNSMYQMQRKLQVKIHFGKISLMPEQKQPFADALRCKCSLENTVTHRKTPVLESLFNKVAGLQTCNFVKTRAQHKYFPVNIA